MDDEPPLVHGRVWADGPTDTCDTPLYADAPRDRLTLRRRLASSLRSPHERTERDLRRRVH
jgi:hypothetical protein